jgi:hypothetical protein
MQAEDEYMISDYDLFVIKFVSVPKEMGHLNCAAFVAGIVRGVLDGAGFPSRYVYPTCAVDGYGFMHWKRTRQWRTFLQLYIFSST